MNILYINCVGSREGLATLDVYTPIKELVERGNMISLISMNDGTPHYKLKYESGGIFKVYPIMPPTIPSSVAQSPIPRTRALFIISLYLTFFLLMLKINRIIKKNRPQLLLSSSDYSLPIISFLLSRINKTPLIMVFRETHLETIFLVWKYHIIFKLAAAFLMFFNHTIFKRIRYSVAISKGFELFLENYLGLKNVTTINLMCYELTKVPRSNKFRSVSYGLGNEIIFYAGSLDPARRLDVLIDAFSEIAKRYVKSRLVIAGNGTSFNLRTYAEKNCENDLRKRIDFLGLLPREEILALLPIVDVCVDPFPCEDWTASCKMVEYMAYGKCVIATDNFRNRSYVQNGINGMLFKPNDVEDLKDKLSMVLRNAELRKELGQNARRTIEKEFDVRKVVSTFEEFCLRVLSDFYGRDS